ncbi:MAG: molecular chaperone TorD family protein [Sedimenticolaceae bacterium]
MNDALSVFRDGISLDLMTFAQLHDRELDGSTVSLLQAERFPEGLAFRLESAQAKELLSMLALIVAEMQLDDARQRDELAADFASVYLTHGVGAAPCESVWLDEDGLIMRQPMFEVRRSYAQLGLRAPDWRKRPDDHLVYQLQFVAALLEHDSASALSDAARFLDEHTLRWLPDFAKRVAQRAATPFYAGLAMLTSVYLDELRDVLAQILGEPRPTALEIEQRIKSVAEEPLPMPSAYVPGSSPSW